MINIINLHRKDTSNVGDLKSAPLLYLGLCKEQKVMEVTGWKYEDPIRRERWVNLISQADGIILGGGGLLEFHKYEDTLNYLSSLNKRIVIWGAGHNSVNSSWANLKPKFTYKYKGFGLRGVRDWGYSDIGFTWVPCASCLSDLFDVKIEKKNDVVFFFNNGIANPESYLPKGISDNLIMSNMKTSMENVIEFLGSADTVVTSSYHGAYWATLLGKKVVGIPTSSKFYGLKHSIPLCHISDWTRYSKLAISYPEALDECREANRRFSDTVMDYFSS